MHEIKKYYKKYGLSYFYYKLNILKTLLNFRIHLIAK